MEKGSRETGGSCLADSGCEGDREEVSRGQGWERIVSGRRLRLIGHATLGIRKPAVGMGWAGSNKG